MIGQLSGENEATQLGDFLRVEGILTEMEPNSDGTFLIWILDEERVEQASTLLKEFQANPADPRFQGHAKQARVLKERERQEVKDLEARVKGRADLMRNHAPFGIGPLSGFILFVCGAVFLLTEEGTRLEITQQFFIGFAEAYNGQSLAEVRQGEVWRLFTPALLHFGWMHLICNSLWIYSLGSLLEARRGTGFLLAFVVATSVIPNLAQYWVYHNPFFGGMSGVTFAMAGYAWQRGRHDPGSGIGLESSTMIMLVIYFVLCWMQELNLSFGVSFFGGPQKVANVVHAAGLAMGAAWGWWDSRRMIRLR